MREILFRGKRLDNGEWVEGYFTMRPSAIQIGDYSPWYISVPPLDPDDDGCFYNVDPATVGQYTGLQDKNGKRIFEGDMCRLKGFSLFARGNITFQNGCFWFVDVDCGVALRLCDVKPNRFVIEIIGNIYDN